MLNPRSQFLKRSAGILAALIVLSAAALSQGSEQIIFSFDGGNGGGLPRGPLLQDAAGRLYGTTLQGGTQSSGVVFALSPSAGGGWNYRVLHSFKSAEEEPLGRLVFDAAGNLYGTNATVVYKLSHDATGQWKEKVLHTFTDNPDGFGPVAGLTIDAAGNLYGTTAYGGTQGKGTVYELSPNSDGSWTESVLHSFGGSPDADFPGDEVILDSAGNLYGTTFAGGDFNAGAVFELSPGSGGWTEKVIYSFTGTRVDEGAPEAALWMDPSGNLFGTTQGVPIGNGTVFELVRNSDGTWTESKLHSFDRTGIHDGFWPSWSSVVPDKAGNLYSTTLGGGLIGYGIVYRLKPGSAGGWSEQQIYSFAGSPDGANPTTSVLFGLDGAIYGTTEGGGSSAHGTIYRIAP
jgi:uncharacterized repeat protein (TIGR03803 family)